MEDNIHGVVRCNSVPDDAEVSHIAEEYMNMVRSQFIQYKNSLSPNCLVDWFGRSIKGPQKVYQYMRYDVMVQYNHVLSTFDNAKACQPIETRPTHFKTRLCSEELKDESKPLLSRTPEVEFERNLEDLGLSTLPQASDGEQSEEAYESPKTPKRKERNNRIVMETEIKKSSEEMCSNTYSGLRYMEMSGILRSYVDKTAIDLNQSDNCWDRPVRIRLSYRKNLSNEKIEFVLIIYENAAATGTAENPSHSRRNLMMEFNKTAESPLSSPVPITDNDDDIVNLSLGDDLDVEINAIQEDDSDIEVSDEDLRYTSTPEPTVARATTPTAEFNETSLTIIPLRTPTKSTPQTPPTPKRRPRTSSLKRTILTPTAPPPKRTAARNLRL